MAAGGASCEAPARRPRASILLPAGFPMGPLLEGGGLPRGREELRGGACHEAMARGRRSSIRLHGGLPMKLLLKGGRVVDPATGTDAVLDVRIENGKIVEIARDLRADGARILDVRGL